MKDDFEKILDDCIDRMNRGESLDSCLADFPDHAAQLKPLLQAMLVYREAYPFTPSPDVKRANKARFNTALENLARQREESKQGFAWLHGWSRVWVTAAAVLVIAVISYFSVRAALPPEGTILQPGPDSITPDLQPTQTMVVMLPQPDPQGNFAFLISDDVNAIGDFASVNVSILKISLQRGDDTGPWIEFEPELTEVDLTLVQGEKTQEIWRGNIPEGEYNQVSIEVSDVTGILKDNVEEVEIKLPGQKLHISDSFSVNINDLTTFTYDLTVIAAGNDQSGIKYILKPQADQSGASYKPIGSQNGPGKNVK
jgi:hypothetical protein